MSNQYTFKLNRKVTPTSAVAIEYTLEYLGDKLFLERCVNVAKSDEEVLGLEYEHSYLNFLQPKDTRHYYVSISPRHYYVSISHYANSNRVNFSEFLQGENICFECPQAALAFEKLVDDVIQKWLDSQWIKYVKIQAISSQ